jgi:CheY-like chemotaxis protein
LNRRSKIRIGRRRGKPQLGERRRRFTSPTRHGCLSHAWRTGEIGQRFREHSGLPSGAGATDGRVLIVDDESPIRLVCRVNLTSVGFETVEAETGEAALEIVRTERPDLILLDIMLPGLDGWKVAEELRSAKETSEIPILFLTARSNPVDEERAYALGGLGYITKPFDPGAMTEQVRNVIERARRGERDEIRREWLRSLRRED